MAGKPYKLTTQGEDERFDQTLGGSPTGSADRTGCRQVLAIVDGDEIIVAVLEGEILVEHTRSAPGMTYVGNGRARGPRPQPSHPSPTS